MNTTSPAAPALAGAWQQLRISAQMVPRYAEQLMLLSVAPVLLVQLGSFLQPRHTALGIAVSTAGSLWLLINVPVLYYFEINAVRGKAPTAWTAYREGLRYFGRIVGLMVVTTVLIILGLVFFIIPGAVMIRRYALAPFYIVDKHLSIGEAMRQSAQDSAAAARYIWSSLGVVMLVSFGILAASQTFQFVPGLPEVITALATVVTIFVLPLRYSEITAKHKRKLPA